ncbi:SpoIIAA family protein [Acidiluteibacter ferrifornacis]|uniref:STAS/SEC14 domain-containing protein n=1 Tax=Acidiluteibacter ferrifornacis TaxID=2692424 RepID=A0A6N9NIP6_9FLAO|nr:STAS/SEC14 domain-containing protein [Acidiluteibacter ferrifornacis]NBG65719.1 STAS/SEC14 domain-containing protein [Acidiluteibacter ferrifornacis]
MIKITTGKENIYTIATDKLTDKDYDQLLPLLREKITIHKHINWLFQMKDFKGWSLSAFWRDVKFDIKNKEKFNKIAIVGHSDWQEVMTELMKPFTNADIRYFKESHVSKAKNWIKE